MKTLCARGRWWLVALLVVGAAVGAVQRVSAGPGYSAVILADMPLGYWRLGESDPSMPAADASGNGNDGTYNAGVTLGQAGAIVGDPDTAVAFDGSTGYVDIPSSAGGTFDLRNGFTLEAWVINNGQFGSGEAGRIFSNREPGYGLGVKHVAGETLDSVRFTTFSVKDYDSDLTVVPQDGNWHHVVLVLDSTNTANFYLDGQLTESIAGPGPAHGSNSHLYIGSNPVSPEYFNGNIDEAAVYNYELTADQIAAHYAAAQ